MAFSRCRLAARRSLLSAVARGAFVALAGCSATAVGAEAPDAAALDGGPAIRPDASDREIDGGAPSLDAGTDAGHAPDAGASPGECFDEIELVRLGGGREAVVPFGLFDYDAGWVLTYGTSSHGDDVGRFAAFIDRDGRITQTLELPPDPWGESAVIGRFILSWQYGQVQLREIGDGELIDRSELLEPAVPTPIVAVERATDRLRILSAPGFDLDAGRFPFAYSELVLGDGGGVSVRTAALANAETLGSPGLVAGLRLYHGTHFVTMPGETVVAAFPTGEDPFSIDGQPWNVMRLALDRSALEDGAASWMVQDETRWEEGPLSMFGAFPELDLAVVGRFRPAGGDAYWPAVTAERFVGLAPLAPVLLNDEGDGPSGGLARAVIRRGDAVGLRSPGRFRLLSLPDFDELASVPLELDHALVAWGDGQVLEVGSRRLDEGLIGLVRCHTVPPSP